MKNLFICGATNTFTTALLSCISKCKNAICMPIDKDGQHYFHTIGPLCHIEHWPTTCELNYYQSEHEYKWDKIRDKWEEVWSLAWNYKTGTLKIERSTTNPLRMNILHKQFPEAYFLILVRHPIYSAEGLRRRHGHSFASGVKHFLKVLELLKESEEFIPANQRLRIRYVDWVTNPEKTRREIVSFTPELYDIIFKNINARPTVGGVYDKIVNMNELQKNNISQIDIKSVEQLLEDNKELLHHFGY